VIEPLSEQLGARVLDLDASRPIDDGTWAAVHDAFLRYSVLVLPNQSLTKSQHVAFSRRFGTLEHHVLKDNTDPEVPEIFLLGSVEEPLENL
jgi:taurine dioxygenase